MAHLWVLRSCPSFVEGKDLTLGQHESIEQAINKRKYKLNKYRKGYNIPSSSEWHLMEYRVKKECIPEFVRDLGGFLLNPEVNKTSLWSIIRKKTGPTHKSSDLSYGAHIDVTVGKSLLLIQWGFKWINRLFRLVGFPMQSVPIAEGIGKKFVDGWGYHYIIGVFPDIEGVFGEEL